MGGIRLREAGASVADYGTLLPITAALVVGNGVDPVAALTLAGALFVVAGLYYRVPVPVQPIKAAAAIAIATGASPRVIAAGGLGLGAVLLGLSAVPGAARALVRVFPKPIIRGNQLGVGILLLYAAAKLIGTDDGSDLLEIAVAVALVALLFASAERRFPVALGLIAGGVVWSILWGERVSIDASFALPAFDAPRWRDIATAFTLLVIPQLPLTLGNAVVGTADLEREYYGARAARVTPRALLTSCGLANVAVGAFGGMPLCHGSSGATAYKRFGARTGGVSLVAGTTLLVAGVLFGRTALDLFALIPAPVLGAMLAYTALRHALLVGDQRGWALGVALAMGIVGGVTRNLTYGMMVGLPAYLVFAGGTKIAARARR